MFVCRSNHSAIKYRQPGLAAVTAFFFAAYTLALPPIVCFDNGDAIDVRTRIVISNALLLVGGVSFILSQCIIVVKFAITEVLLDPRTATEARVRRVQSLRWILYPRAQMWVWVATSAVVCAPTVHLLVTLPHDFTSHDLANGLHPITQTFNLVSTLEVAAMTILSWGLTRKISRVVDNFGLRSTYLSISKYIAVCLVGYGMTLLLPHLGVAVFLDEFYASAMISMHGGQAVCFMLITMPLRQSFLTAETHREMRLRRRRLQTDVDELDYKVFYRYLSTTDGYKAVLTFCRMELAPELLLAWHEVERFKLGEATVDHIYDKVLEPHSELFQVDLADDVRIMYAQLRNAVCTSTSRNAKAGTVHRWKNKVDVLFQPVVVAAARASVSRHASVTGSPDLMSSSSARPKKCDSTFFHPLSAELLRLLYLHVLPRFEEFPQSYDWIVFRNTEKAMVSLDAVNNMVRKTIVATRHVVSMTPNIDDIPRTGRMLTKPQEELQ
ncbi:hypothetical protein DYB32_007072 [Aphanomyces invadans]|uniref:RGS domain-containing protein n=1 Tax=Aphanomyces invadans TaxID=157072 RepID=A0A418APH3_9STRA|nr:hypothetical protein DYB32_007072 [Aphanomyces invadans]